MATEVLSFKINGGDEVVANVIKTLRQDNNVDGEIVSYIVRRPHILRFQQVAPGQVGLIFVPWTLSNPEIDRLSIPVASLVIPPFSPSAEVEKQYLEQTSGLVLAQ
jgi:hypothetical protein